MIDRRHLLMLATVEIDKNSSNNKAVASRESKADALFG